MNYFDVSTSRKRSREGDAFVAAEITAKSKPQVFGKQPPINVVDATENPQGGGYSGGGDEATNARAECPFATVDKMTEFRSMSQLSDRISCIPLEEEEFLPDGLYGGWLPGTGVFDHGWVEQLCLGLLPCKAAEEAVCADHQQDGDFGELGLWDDDIWQLWQIHEPPARRKEV